MPSAVSTRPEEVAAARRLGAAERPRAATLDAAEERIRIDVHLDDLDPKDELATLRRGLAEPPRSIPSRYFYDARGSRLFERITRLPEYYLTRAERRLLAAEAPAIAARARAQDLVELGSGAAVKTRLLIDSMLPHGLERYLPFDVDESVVRGASAALAERYPGLAIHGVVGDFTHHLEHIPEGERRLVVFLGSTIGNLDPAETAAFLGDLAARLGDGDRFLLGVDLIKEPAVLQAAYDDASGVTTEFNRNILEVVNRELGGDFEPRRFAHRATWDADNEWMAMHLVARGRQRVRLAALDLEIELADDEPILTEISTKYSRPKVERMLAGAGLALEGWQAGDDERFALALARPAG